MSPLVFSIFPLRDWQAIKVCRQPQTVITNCHIKLKRIPPRGIKGGGGGAFIAEKVIGDELNDPLHIDLIPSIQYLSA